MTNKKELNKMRKSKIKFDFETYIKALLFSLSIVFIAFYNHIQGVPFFCGMCVGYIIYTINADIKKIKRELEDIKENQKAVSTDVNE